MINIFKPLSLLVGYLVVASVLMGFFVYQTSNEQISTLAGTTYTSDVIDFSGNIDLATILDTSLGGAESCEIVNNTLVITPPVLGDVSIFFKGIQPDENGLYVVEYGLNNTANADFSIIVTSETSTFSPKMLTVRYSHDNEKMDIIYSSSSVLGQFMASPYFTADINLDGEHTIKTEFNVNTKELTVTIDAGNEIIVSINDFNNNEVVHYGGGIISDNFIINYVKTNIVYVPEDITDSNLFIIIAQIIAWNVDEEYMPNTLNVLLIKIPMLFLGIAIAMYVRGVS